MIHSHRRNGRTISEQKQVKCEDEFVAQRMNGKFVRVFRFVSFCCLPHKRRALEKDRTCEVCKGKLCVYDWLFVLAIKCLKGNTKAFGW